MTKMPYTPDDFVFMSPVAALIVTGLILVVAESFVNGKKRALLAQLSVLGCVVTMGLSLWMVTKLPGVNDGKPLNMFSGMLVADRVSYFLIALFSGITALTVMIGTAHQTEHDWPLGEFYGLILLSTSGMAILAMAGDLVTVFIGIETMSLAVYALVAGKRDDRKSSEGAMKYFLMGAFASGFLVYGMALLYGATGSTNLLEMKTIIEQDPTSPIIMLGTFMLIVAFGFKIAAVPFHMWTPDAYEGAPSPVTGYMAAAVKAAAVAGLAKVFLTTLGGDVIPFGRLGWTTIFGTIAAITMTLGNLGALAQQNVKRMLAYSSVSHAGVILVGVVAAGISGKSSDFASVLYYLLAYSVTTMGAFAVIVYIGDKTRERVMLSDWHGFGAAHPAAALAMTVFLLSLGGMPPTTGFFGKFIVFKSALQAYDGQLIWLVVVGVINSMISIYYYLRIVTAMYFRDASGEFKVLRSPGVIMAMIICAFLVLQMGIMPGRWLSFVGG